MPRSSEEDQVERLVMVHAGGICLDYEFRPIFIVKRDNVRHLARLSFAHHLPKTLPLT